MAKYASESNEVYSNVKTQTSDNDWVFTQWYDNGLDVAQTSKFTRTESKTDSASWTLTTTVDVGYEFDIEAKVPLAFDETDKFTYSFSSTSSDTQTSTSSQSWSAEEDVTIPPKSTVKLTWMYVRALAIPFSPRRLCIPTSLTPIVRQTLSITKETVTGDYSSDINFPDYAKLWWWVV